MDGGNGDEAEALIQVFIRRASFQQGEGNEVQFSLQHHHQLSVSANRPAGVHQALADKGISMEMHKYKITFNLWCFSFLFFTIAFSLMFFSFTKQLHH